MSIPSYEISSPISHDIYDNKGILIYKAGSYIIRSLKSVHQYHFGILLKPLERSNPNDPSFEMTDLNNERKCVRLSQLVYMAKNLPYAVSGYPRHANMVSLNCRNERAFINKKLKTPQLDNTTRFYPKFNIIEDIPQDKRMVPIQPDIQVPIESTDGSEYYGRKDCRTTFR